MTHVQGKHTGDIILYALSTCGWCQKTKKLLNELGVDYYYLDVDKSVGEERENALREIQKWNPDINFPTLVIDDNKCITGFREEEIREVLTGE